MPQEQNHHNTIVQPIYPDNPTKDPHPNQHFHGSPQSADVMYYNTHPQIPQQHYHHPQMNPNNTMQPVMDYQTQHDLQHDAKPLQKAQPPVKKAKKRTCLKLCCAIFGIVALVVLVLLVAGGIAGIVVGVGCANAVNRKVTDFNFDLATASTPITKLKVMGAGNIKFFKGNHDSKIYGNLNVRSRTSEDVYGSLAVDPTDPSVLLLDTRRPKRWSLYCIWIERVIYLPDNSFTRNLALEISAESENFETQESSTFIFKSANIRSDSGNLKLNNIETKNEFSARTDSGNIRATSIVSGAATTFRTSSGNIGIDSCSSVGSVTSSSSSGNVNLYIEKAASISMTSDSGNLKVRIENFEGSFDMSTDSGSNSLTNSSTRSLYYSKNTGSTKRGYVGTQTPENNLYAETNSGNINVTLL